MYVKSDITRSFYQFGMEGGGGVPLEKKFIKLLQFVTLLEPQPVDQEGGPREEIYLVVYAQSDITRDFTLP